MAVTKKQMENLISLKDRSPDERKEISRKGAIAANKARRKKRKLKEIFQMIGSLNVTNNELKKKLEKLGIPPEEITWNVAVAAATMMNAIKKNDIKTVEFVLKMMDDDEKKEDKNSFSDFMKDVE